MVTILCGKSGSGKDYLCNLLVNEEGYEKIVSTTTRPIRKGEVEGVSYFFTDRDDFLNKVENHEIVEYRPYNTEVGGVKDTWYYGTSREALLNLDPNKDYVLIKDLDGAKAIQDFLGKDSCFVCGIQTRDTIRIDRAKARGSYDETEWNRRAKDDDIKFSYERMREITDVILANDGLDGDGDSLKYCFKLLKTDYEKKVKENTIYTEWGNFSKDIKVEEYGYEDSFILGCLPNTMMASEMVSEKVEYVYLVAETKEENTFDGNYKFGVEIGYLNGEAETHEVSLSYEDKKMLGKCIDDFIKDRDNEKDEHTDR